jgi:hypothetical protein
MATVLTWITLAATAVVVVVLVVYLVAVALALTRANRGLAQLAGGLEAIESHSHPLPEDLATINGALTTLLGGLRSVDRHLIGIRQVFRS